jgi:hypothetical protein
MPQVLPDPLVLLDSDFARIHLGFYLLHVIHDEIAIHLLNQNGLHFYLF